MFLNVFISNRRNWIRMLLVKRGWIKPILYHLRMKTVTSLWVSSHLSYCLLIFEKKGRWSKHCKSLLSSLMMTVVLCKNNTVRSIITSDVHLMIPVDNVFFKQCNFVNKEKTTVMPYYDRVISKISDDVYLPQDKNKYIGQAVIQVLTACQILHICWTSCGNI